MRAFVIEKWVRGLLSVDFDFDVVVHVVGCVACAVEANVLGVGALGVDEFAETCIHVGLVRAFALFGGVVVVVVEEGGDAAGEFRIIGYLNDHVMVGAFLRVVVPNPDGREVRWGFEVDLYPLRTVHDLYEIAFACFLVAVGDVFKFADDWEVVAAGYWLAR